MDIRSFLVGVLVGALLLTGAGWLYVQHRDEENAREVAAANARAADYELSYNAYLDAYQELAIQHLDSQEILDAVRERNERLADDLEGSQATVLSLQDQVAELDAKLDSSATTVDRPSDNVFLVSIDESLRLHNGGSVRVRGPVRVTLEPLRADASLRVGARFPITVVISRTESGDMRVDAFTGDPRLSIAAINVEGLATQTTTGPSFGGFLADQLTGVNEWANRILGGVAGIAICKGGL